MALGLLFISAPARDAGAADAPVRKAFRVPSEECRVSPVTRPRSLTRREIFQAIQTDLAQRGISGREGLRPEDLRIQSSIQLLETDAGLQVKKIAYDPIRHETVFELWTSHEPRYLPFEVTTRSDPESWGFASRPPSNLAGARWGSKTVSPPMGPGISQARSKPTVVAKPGRPVTLVIQGQDMRITTTVVPLQPGVKGQRILVRDLATARVMTAEVVDEGLMQASF